MKQNSLLTAAMACGLLILASFNPALAGMNKTETQRFQALSADVQSLSSNLRSQGGDFNSRIARLEQLLEASNMQQMYQRMQTLDEENRQLRGQLEELSHRLQQFTDREKKLNLDVDQRLEQIESRRGSVMSTSPSVGYVDSGSEPYDPNEGYSPNEVTNVLDEQSQYRQSFGYLKGGQYSAAIVGFQQFLQSYPDSSMSPNAQYWLGEANYGAGKFEQAATNFEAVRSQYPGTTKVSDASLKLGYSLYELSRWDQAKSVLQEIVIKQPGSAVANLASTRLQRLKQEGH